MFEIVVQNGSHPGPRSASPPGDLRVTYLSSPNVFLQPVEQCVQNLPFFRCCGGESQRPRAAVPRHARMYIGGRIHRMGTPQHVIFIVIEPKSEADREKLTQLLRQFMGEDPTLGMNCDAQAGKTIVRGVNELQLDIIVDRLQHEFSVEAGVGDPQVAYRETIRKPSEAEGRHIKQSGGHGQYGVVKIRIEPLPGGGFEFVDEIAGGRVPKEYIGSIEAGVREALEGGILAGYPMSDLRVTLHDGSYHDLDSSEMAFKIAGSLAIKEAARRANPVLLEPIMSVEAVVAEEHMGDIIGDLNSRRGRIQSVESRGATYLIKSLAPLSGMLGYASELRSRAHGRAICSMQFDRYEPLSEGPNSDDEDRNAPVLAPRTPQPKHNASGVALPEPDDE